MPDNKDNQKKQEKEIKKIQEKANEKLHWIGKNSFEKGQRNYSNSDLNKTKKPSTREDITDSTGPMRKDSDK